MRGTNTCRLTLVLPNCLLQRNLQLKMTKNIHLLNVIIWFLPKIYLTNFNVFFFGLELCCWIVSFCFEFIWSWNWWHHFQLPRTKNIHVLNWIVSFMSYLTQYNLRIIHLIMVFLWLRTSENTYFYGFSSARANILWTYTDSAHKPLTQCWFNVGPASQQHLGFFVRDTLNQCCFSVGAAWLT